MITRISLVLAACVLLLAACTSNPGYDPYYQRPVYVLPGVGLGTIIAVVVSWSRNKSILWAIIHGILGWVYVIYALLFLRKK
jgi:ABC-type Fe3+-siderophore transport system permease subunit